MAANGCRFREIIYTPRLLDKLPALSPDVRFIETDEKQFAKISILDTPSGILGIAEMPPPLLSLPLQGRFLILDGVRDPGNMGTLIRTAHWFNCTAVICIHDCVEIFNPKVVQSTMGSLFALPCIVMDLSALEHFMAERRELPFYLADMQGTSVYSHEFPPSFILALGSESAGVSKGLKAFTHLPLTIPPTVVSQRPESLNVAVSAAVILGIAAAQGA